MAESTITVYHIKTGWYRSLEASVLINGKDVGFVGMGLHRSFRVPSGTHTVQISIGGPLFYRSNQVSVKSLTEDQEVLLYVIPGAPPLLEGGIGGIIGGLLESGIRKGIQATGGGSASQDTRLTIARDQREIELAAKEFERTSQQRGGCFSVIMLGLLAVIVLLVLSSGMPIELILFLGVILAVIFGMSRTAR